MPRSPDFLKHKTIPELIADTRKPKVIADTAWYKVGATEDYEIPFGAGWANVGASGNPDAQWYVDENGEAKVMGTVDGGTLGTTIFVLPEETRPRHRMVFVCAIEGGGTANIAVYPNGNVVLESYNA